MMENATRHQVPAFHLQMPLNPDERMERARPPQVSGETRNKKESEEK
nr:hypothetical protein [Maliibacterium massiliense]